MNGKKTRVGFVVGNYHTDHPSRLVHQIWELLKDEDVELQVFLGTESASFIKDFTMRSNLFDYQYASLCGYTEYAALDLLIISVGTLCIYQNAIPLDEFLRHTPDIPTILMETDRDPENGISLIADNTQGLASCVEHLIADHGLTRIGFISGPRATRTPRNASRATGAPWKSTASPCVRITSWPETTPSTWTRASKSCWTRRRISRPSSPPTTR